LNDLDGHWTRESSDVAEILGEKPNQILVVSDLHLSAGRDPVTKAWDSLENFCSDDAFSRWIGYQLQRLEGRALLVLNGDVFDFLRVVTRPRKEQEYTRWSVELDAAGFPHSPDLLREVRASEIKHGLSTAQHKSVWKFMVIRDGHPEFFEALRTWVRAGNDVLFTLGNHDVEYHWPAVRRSIKAALVDQIGQTGSLGRVGFVPDSFVLENLYFEHGHEHDWTTRVSGGPFLPGGFELMLPLGSFVNRYYINHLEDLYPFIDNIKPPDRALAQLVKKRPLALLRILLNSRKFVTRAIAVNGLRAKLIAIVAALAFVVPFVAGLGLLLALVLPDFRQWITGHANGWLLAAGGIGGTLLPVILPYARSFVTEAWRALRLELLITRLERKRAARSWADDAAKGLDRCAERTRNALRQALGEHHFQRIYAVVGHTHEKGVKPLSSDVSRELLVNSGTWIAIWPEMREDLAGKTIFSFVRFTQNAEAEYRHELLDWDDFSRDERPSQYFLRRD